MKPVSFYLVTDTHYLNNVLEPGGEAFEKNMVTEQYFVKESHAITSYFAADFVAYEEAIDNMYKLAESKVFDC